MTNSKPAKPASAYSKVLRLIGLLFFIGWLFTTIVTLLMGASWREVGGSIILFGGFALAWIVTIYKLQRKSPEYIQELVSESEVDNESKPS